MSEVEQSVYVTHSQFALPKLSGIKARLRGSIRHTILSTIGLLPSKQNGPFLRCLYCHHVFEDQVKRFRAIMEVLRERGRFVDTDTCVSMLRGETPIDDAYFHLSFDDGFRNVYQNAAPILKELGIPAIVFVPTSLVGAGWEAARRFSLQTAGYQGVIEMMTWNDLQTLKTWGFEIGSHTRNHAKLSILSDHQALNDETFGSRLDIENHIGSECKYISWPYGRRSDINNDSLEAVKRAGYVACFGAFRGSAKPRGTTSTYSIPRHHFEVQWPLSHISYFASGSMEG